MKKSSIAMGVSVAFLFLVFIGLASESFGLIVFGAIAAAITFFGVAPVLVKQENKEKEEALARELVRKQIEIDKQDQQRWEQGHPTFLYLSPGHFSRDTGNWFANYPNHVNCWDVNGSLKNVSPYVINYVHIYYYPTDRIGTKVHDTEVLKFTGPLSPKQFAAISDRDKWYKLSVHKVVIEKIAVDYQDGSTQITSLPLYTTIQYGHRTAEKAWIKGSSCSDGSWNIQTEVRYFAGKPANKIVFHIVPVDYTGTPLDSPAVLAFRSSFQHGQMFTGWWGDLWKGMAVKRIQLKKYVIEHTDGTKQIVEF